ncbi:MAG: Holliday junction resolvase RuvX [Prevotellaceae bacterium]|nr:Holliday junction resolvase RuvX [Prevotellaceae bacterium]
MSRIISIDYGLRRIGLAVSDPTQTIAGGLATVTPNDVFTFLENYCANNLVEKFVIGLPKQMNGADSQIAPHVRKFAETLQKRFPVQEIVFFDERFTSVLAHKAMLEGGLRRKARRDKALVDKISATIILEEFLEFRV